MITMPPEGDSWPRAAVFDLDGTLVDSLPDIAAALNVALCEAGHRALAQADIAGMMGHGSEALVARAVAAVAGDTPAIAAALHTRFLAAYAAAPCRLSKLYPGAIDTLEALATQHVALAICTNKPAGITSQVLQALQLSHRFACVIGGRSGVPLKPAPDMLLQALQAIGAPADGAVMVGDSAADAGAARAAGTRLVLMRHGYSRVSVDGLGADAVLDGLAQLPAALARMTFAGA
jgi:phosphoglycolate phosphatase